MTPASLLRNVEIDGQTGKDVRIADGRIAEIGKGLGRCDSDIDGRGGALIAGLVDHHCHILASAARATSLQLDDVRTVADLANRLKVLASAGQGWARATGCPSVLAQTLDRHALDMWCGSRPLRVQDQTGTLWIINSAGLALVTERDPPALLERDGRGELNGRIRRGDAWLGRRIGRHTPPLAPVGRQLAALGITALTDASATNDGASAALLSAAHRQGDLPQRLMLMSAGPMALPFGSDIAIGPVKILLDDHDLIPLDAFVARIVAAREQARSVAVHCVTAAELALTLAAFAQAGSCVGDRIEHGGIIPAEAIDVIAAMGLTVVTQSGFIDTRGDRYLTDVDVSEHGDLYRCASLIGRGIRVAGSSDAPYGEWDCWRAMRTALTRQTQSGRAVGVNERVSAANALDLYRSAPNDPGGPPRRVIVGMPADLCLLRAPLAEVLDQLDANQVVATWIDGRLVYDGPWL